MDGFKLFIEDTTKKEAWDSIKKLPKAHRKLVRGFNIETEKGCVLKNYPDSVGLVELGNGKKVIKLAAPMNYGREWTLFHEIGHLVFEEYIANNYKLKKQWQNLVRKANHEVKQNAEEIFAHTYAQCYSKNKLIKYDYPQLIIFIKNLTK